MSPETSPATIKTRLDESIVESNTSLSSNLRHFVATDGSGYAVHDPTEDQASCERNRERFDNEEDPAAGGSAPQKGEED